MEIIYSDLRELRTTKQIDQIQVTQVTVKPCFGSYWWLKEPKKQSRLSNLFTYKDTLGRRL